MNRIDDNLTRRMQAWLSAPAGGRDIREGAEMLLRLTRNRILHANILRRPDKMASKLEYELKKHLRIRLDGLTRRDVALMEREVMPRAGELLATGGLPEISSEADQPAPAHEGRRADHDALPEEIRRLWDDNADIWFRIKQTYNTLLSMEHAAPCDRYDHLKMLDELDRRYRDNLARYDAYDPAAAGTAGSDLSDDDGAAGGTCAAPTAAEVSAARKYLSTNRAKLEAAVAEGDDDKAGKIRETMQQRVDTVLRAGESFKQDYRDALAALGLLME